MDAVKEDMLQGGVTDEDGGIGGDEGRQCGAKRKSSKSRLA